MGTGEARSGEDRSNLCLSCGLCCQGVLHDLVPLEEDELDRAAKLRLPVVESPLRLAFSLPCPRLEERRCTVYLERPRTCASYACETLRAYGAGEIDEAAALARIASVRELSARVSGLAGAHPGAPSDTERAGMASELSRMRQTWFDP